MRFLVYLTPRQGMWVFGGAALATLAVAFYIAWAVTVELRTWPRVEAHVDSADVATVGSAKGRPLYAARFQLSYRYQGLNYRTSITQRQHWDEYGFAAKEATQALQAGQLTVMLDPHRPGSAIPREGAAGAPFVIAAAFGVIGILFIGFAIVAWRTGQWGGLDRVARLGAQSPRFAIMIFVGMGVLFIGSAVVGAIIGPEGKHWTPVQGEVTSVDVIETSPGTYAVRTWYSYIVSGQTYRAPVMANTSRSSLETAHKLASEAEHGGVAALLVDPSNPNRVTSARVSRVEGIVIPAAFGLFGIVLIAIGLVIRRRGMGSYIVPAQEQ